MPVQYYQQLNEALSVICPNHQYSMVNSADGKLVITILLNDQNDPILGQIAGDGFFLLCTLAEDDGGNNERYYVALSNPERNIAETADFLSYVADTILEQDQKATPGMHR